MEMIDPTFLGQQGPSFFENLTPRNILKYLAIITLFLAIPFTVLIEQRQQQGQQNASTNDLATYPRPNQDTGIGIHWSADTGNGYDTNTAQNVICPLKQMGISWIKVVANHTEEVNFARVMKQNDIEPIVRLYRPQPEPNTLPTQDLEAVDQYVAAGVSYFESSNEPNLTGEWQGNALPECTQAATQTVQAWVQDALHIQERGGYPVFPALAPGGNCDDVQFLINSFNWLKANICPLADGTSGSCTNLFDATHSNGKPAVVGMHNYDFNHDNQKDGSGNIQFYNDDSNAFLKFITYNNIIIAALGRSVPILGTEDGTVVGDNQDSRFPQTDASWHRDVTVGIAKYQMSNTSPYFFNTAFWLALPNADNSTWKNAAWFNLDYSSALPSTLDTLKNLPKTTRNGVAYSSACTPPQSATKVYMDTDTPAPNQTVTVTATGPTSCSADWKMPNDSSFANSGFVNCQNTQATCSQANPQNDGNQCWFQFSCQTTSTPGQYTARFNAGGLNCASSKSFTVVNPLTPTPAPSPTSIPTATPTTTVCNQACISGTQCINGTCVPISTPTVHLGADVDGNGCVGINDFNVWFQALRSNNTTGPADINRDGRIDLLDFNTWFTAMRTLPANQICH